MAAGSLRDQRSGRGPWCAAWRKTSWPSCTHVCKCMPHAGLRTRRCPRSARPSSTRSSTPARSRSCTPPWRRPRRRSASRPRSSSCCCPPRCACTCITSVFPYRNSNYAFMHVLLREKMGLCAKMPSVNGTHGRHSVLQDVGLYKNVKRVSDTDIGVPSHVPLGQTLL